MKDFGVPQAYITNLSGMYIETSFKVRVGRTTSTQRKTTRGLRQGFPASCLLFNVFLARLLGKTVMVDAGVPLGTTKEDSFKFPATGLVVKLRGGPTGDAVGQ